MALPNGCRVASGNYMNLGNRGCFRKANVGAKKWRLAPGGEPAAREPGRGTGRGDVTGDA